MASVLIQISAEVNIDIIIVICILMLSLLSYTLARTFVLDERDRVGEELELGNEASEEECEYLSAEDETGLIPEDINTLAAEYWVAFRKDEVANLENYLEID